MFFCRLTVTHGSIKFSVSNIFALLCVQLVDEQLPCLETRSNLLVAPPLAYGEQFEDVYEVVLVLDDREQFTSRG